MANHEENRALATPEDWVFKRQRTGETITISERHWHPAVRAAALQLQCDPEELVCQHNPTKPPQELTLSVPKDVMSIMSKLNPAGSFLSVVVD